MHALCAGQNRRERSCQSNHPTANRRLAKTCRPSPPKRRLIKHIPPTAFAKWRTISEQRARYARKRKLRPGPAPFVRCFNLTSGSPSGPHEFLGKLRWLAVFIAARQCRCAEKKGTGRMGQKAGRAIKSPAQSRAFQILGRSICGPGDRAEHELYEDSRASAFTAGLLEHFPKKLIAFFDQNMLNS